MPDSNKRLLTTLLVLCAVLFATTLIGAGGWYWTWQRAVFSVDALGPTERLKLARELAERSPGVFELAWFDERIAYTLQAGQEVSFWGHTFVPNALGFRAPPPAKPPGVFRVLFVGDSWTFGTGVAWEESYPKQFEAIANRSLQGARRVEAWTLAVPGYNTVNQMAALEFFIGRLEPDAVVFNVMANDLNSSHRVGSNGRLIRSWWGRREFEDRLSLMFHWRAVDSHLFRSRWRAAMDRIGGVQAQLDRLEIPYLMHFIAKWDEPFVHYLMSASGLDAPYLVTPDELMVEEYLNPPPARHANPEGNRLYGRIVYRGMAALLDWPELALAQDEIGAPLHREPPQGEDWTGWGRYVMRGWTERKIPERFRPGKEVVQCVGVMECRTGAFGRETMVLVRRRPQAERLEITVRRVEGAPLLYPLELEVSVPSAGGGTRTETTVPAQGPARHRFTLPVPADVEAGAALDVVFRGGGVTSAPDARAPRSVLIESIEQR